MFPFGQINYQDQNPFAVAIGIESGSTPPRSSINYHQSGNSLTYFTTVPIPGTVSAFYDARDIPNAYAYYATDGLTFKNHYESAPSQASVDSGTWSIGVLQNISNAGASSQLSDHLQYGKLLYERYKLNNATCQVVLYETLPYAYGSTSYPSVFLDATDMMEKNKYAYETLRDEINLEYPVGGFPVTLCSVGRLLYYMGVDLPPSHRFHLNGHIADKLHMNDNSAAIVALSLFATTTGQSAIGLLSSSEFTALGFVTNYDDYWLTSDTQVEEIVDAWSQLEASPVLIITDPINQTANEGDDVVFTIEARGVPELSYQWYFDDDPIIGETNNTLTLVDITSANYGQYKCRASNGVYFADSLVATLADDFVVPDILINFTRFGILAGTSGGLTYNDIQANNADQITSIGPTFALVDSSNNPTGIQLHLDDSGVSGSGGANSNGPTGQGTWPDNVTTTFFVGVTSAGNDHDWHLSGFPPGFAVKFGIYGWRAIDGSARQTEIGDIGSTGIDINYNAGVGSATLVEVTAIADMNGEIHFNPRTGAGNTIGFFYYGLLRISPP